MSKTTEIVNHTKGMDKDTKAVVGTKGQVQLIKKEDDMPDIYEFYDTEAEAKSKADAWKAE